MSHRLRFAAVLYRLKGTAFIIIRAEIISRRRKTPL